VHVSVGKQLEILENNAQFTPQVRYLFLFDFTKTESCHGSLARDQWDFGINGFDNAGFAAAYLANHVGKFSFFKGKIHFFQYQIFILVYSSIREFNYGIEAHFDRFDKCNEIWDKLTSGFMLKDHNY
jgi:hypothetical protein